MNKNGVGGKVKSLYTKPMARLLVILFFMQIGFSAMAAQSKDHWYKVESQEEEKKTKTPDPYPYDSVEKDAPTKVFREVGFWSLRPKLGLSGGFHADKSFFKEKENNRFFLNASVQFLTKPWHRVTANAQLIQNNSMFIGGSWEFTPSRKRIRNYYGLGLAHLLVSQKEFSNLVDWDHYYVTIKYGWEFLLANQYGWNAEIKGFWSGNNYAVQASIGYIIPF